MGILTLLRHARRDYEAYRVCNLYRLANRVLLPHGGISFKTKMEVDSEAYLKLRRSHYRWWHHVAYGLVFAERFVNPYAHYADRRELDALKLDAIAKLADRRGCACCVRLRR